MISEPNDEECDATDDDQGKESRKQKIKKELHE